MLFEVCDLLTRSVLVDGPGLNRLGRFLPDLVDVDAVLRALAVRLLDVVLKPDLPTGQFP